MAVIESRQTFDRQRREVMILVTFAADAEFAGWRRTSGFRRVDRVPVPVYSAKYGDSEVRVVLTGVALRALRHEFREFLRSADICIASGLAGGLRDKHSLGEVLVAKQIHRAGDPSLASDAALLAIACRSGAKPVDSFLTTDVVVNTPEDKRRLGIEADAVDMETYEIFRQAKEYGVPVVAVRALSDDASTPMPMDFNRVIGERGNIQGLQAALEIVKAPHRLPRLMRFAVDSSRAARNLGTFLTRYMSALNDVRIRA